LENYLFLSRRKSFHRQRKSPNLPIVTNLREDPFEKVPFEADDYRKWQANKMWTLVPAQAIAGKFISTFIEYPPSQKVGSFKLDEVMRSFSAVAGSRN
jgi:arylsulfatase